MAVAFLSRKSKHIDISFYLRMIDAKNKSTFKRMDEHFKNHPETRAFINAKPILQLPDFSDLSLKIPFSEPIEFLIFEDGKVETNLQKPAK
ncbi:hypothetical protein [Pseudomonas sp.]|jgi:hypothetical protein|uniref:hypothetical protein n=1 Tax=Pseudomonas sp. TaxID=306 RepID=UPI0037CCC2FE